MAADAFRTQ